jgi:Nuclease-related domain
VAETPPDGGWDARADWEAQVKAARQAAAQAAGDADTGPLGEATESPPAAPGAAGQTAPAMDVAQAPAPGPAVDAVPALDATRAPAATAVAEPDVPAQTVPLVPFTPFIAPLAPAVPVTGLDADQAGLAVAAARVSAGRGMSGILGQDHSRADVMPLRFLSPRLAFGQRHRWWLWRAGSAIAAGGLAGALIGWPVGLIAAGLVLCTGALFSYRVSPAFSPTARAPSARRRTKRRLARLGSAGYLSLHGRAIPGTGQVIDHLVVGPAGIYAVDSEVWDRRLPVRATRGGKLFHGPRDQAARLEHARWEADQAAALIGAALGQPITARPAMVIYGPTVPWIVVRIGGVDVFCGRRLRKYLRREATSRSGYLDDRQIEAICEIAAQVLPPAG